MDELLYEVRDGVGYVTFNRPQARNALTFAMYERLAEILAHVAHQHEVVAFAVRDRRAQPQQRFLGRLQGERRVARDEARDLLGALHEHSLVVAQLIY